MSYQEKYFGSCMQSWKQTFNLIDWNGFFFGLQFYFPIYLSKYLIFPRLLNFHRKDGKENLLSSFSIKKLLEKVWACSLPHIDWISCCNIWALKYFHKKWKLSLLYPAFTSHPVVEILYFYSFFRNSKCHCKLEDLALRYMTSISSGIFFI